MLLELCCLEEEEEEVFHPPTLRVHAPLYRQGPGYKVASGCPAAGFFVAAALARVLLPSAPLPGRRLLYKVPLSPGPAYPGYMPPTRLGSFRGEGVCLVQLVEAVRGWRHSGLQPLPLLSGPCRLGPSVEKISASCWRSRFFGRSWPPRLGVAVIPGTSAGKLLCPWPTQIVIPMTLAPETGEVSWDSMGLRRVLFLAEVYSRPSKSQGFSSGWKVVDLEVRFRGVSPTISGCASSRTEPAGAGSRPPAGFRLLGT
jgi:hypothetical protein